MLYSMIGPTVLTQRTGSFARHFGITSLKELTFPLPKEETVEKHENKKQSKWGLLFVAR